MNLNIHNKLKKYFTFSLKQSQHTGVCHVGCGSRGHVTRNQQMSDTSLRRHRKKEQTDDNKPWTSSDALESLYILRHVCYETCQSISNHQIVFSHSGLILSRPVAVPRTHVRFVPGSTVRAFSQLGQRARVQKSLNRDPTRLLSLRSAGALTVTTLLL